MLYIQYGSFSNNFCIFPLVLGYNALTCGILIHILCEEVFSKELHAPKDVRTDCRLVLKLMPFFQINNIFQQIRGRLLLQTGMFLLNEIPARIIDSNTPPLKKKKKSYITSLKRERRNWTKMKPFFFEVFILTFHMKLSRIALGLLFHSISLPQKIDSMI